jgi:tetratricopeptide (TPR) repeat protein
MLNILQRGFMHLNCLLVSLALLFPPFLAATSQVLFDRAERLFDEHLYADASPLYEEAMQSNPSIDLAQSLLSRLISCYLELGAYQKAYDLLNQIPPSTKERTYLLALSLRHLKRHQEAIALLETLPPLQKEEPKAKLEMGINCFYAHLPSKLHFQSIARDAARPYWLAQLYLIRLDLKQGDFISAKKSLLYVDEHMPLDEPLATEQLFLQGLSAFLTQQYATALNFFEQALTKKMHVEAAYYLARTYLKLAENSICQKELPSLFAKAQKLLQSLLPQDEPLALMELYSLKARLLQDAQAYAALQDLLIKEGPSLSPEEQFRGMLLQASAAPSYKERHELYQQLLNKESTSHLLRAQAWYLKGLNDYQEGLQLSSPDLLQQAALAFQSAHQLGKDDFVLQYQALALYHQKMPLKMQAAWDLLVQATEQKKQPEELYYLGALIGSDLLKEQKIPFATLEQFLQHALSHTNSQSWQESFLKILAPLYFQQDHFLKADACWAKLSDSEALFWRAKCAEKAKKWDEMRHHLQAIYLNDPLSPYAPQAYFSAYSYREYLQGSRKALRHLQAMPTLFPNQPILINAYYLMGLDAKKDRFANEGKLVHAKDLTAAINAFQKSEALFDRLYEQNLIASIELPHFTHIRYRAQLERALTNFAIAKESQGAKRRIYLEYAAEVLEQLQSDFHSSLPLIAQFSSTSYPEILEESEFHLAHVYLEREEKDKANRTFDHMLTHYQEGQQSYFLSRLWFEKGKLAQHEKNWDAALTCFEKAAVKKLNTDEKLGLWIEQSSCYKEKGQFEEAMRILSKVVNDEAISALRVKAMFLRAEIYESQGKPELALKQLEATSKKGGEWGQKAREKLLSTIGI